ncbi:MAG: TetR/AcrR family transcriptional regulator [bacterium]|nr:MAG: TetR/AcrR family transcriptional regulator [bacterium]
MSFDDPSAADPGPIGNGQEEVNASGALSRESSSWKEDERRRAKELILSGAMELFADYGYEGTSVKQIADRAKLSVGKLYLHFESKEDIFRELLENYLGEFHRKRDERCNPDDSPLDQLRCRLAVAIDHLRDNSKLLLIFINENPMRLKGLVKNEMCNYCAHVAGLIKQAIECGEMRDEDPEAVSAILIGAIHRLMYMFAESGNTAAFNTAASLIDRIILKPLEISKDDATGTEED